MKLHRTRRGILASENDNFYSIPGLSWDDLIARDHLLEYVAELVQGARPAQAPAAEDILAPIGSQEVWAAGVTYYRSRDARMQESKKPVAAVFMIASTSPTVPSFFSKRRRTGWWDLTARWRFVGMPPGPCPSLS